MFKTHVIECAKWTAITALITIATFTYFDDIISTITSHQDTIKTLLKNLLEKITPLVFFGLNLFALNIFNTLSCLITGAIPIRKTKTKTKTRTNLNQTTKNLLLLRKTRGAILILTSTLLTIVQNTTLPNTTLFYLFTPILFLYIGQFCVTFKYLTTILNNSKIAPFTALSNSESRLTLAINCFWRLEENTLYLVKETTKKNITIGYLEDDYIKEITTSEKNEETGFLKYPEPRGE